MSEKVKSAEDDTVEGKKHQIRIYSSIVNLYPIILHKLRAITRETSENILQTQKWSNGLIRHFWSYYFEYIHLQEQSSDDKTSDLGADPFIQLAREI